MSDNPAQLFCANHPQTPTSLRCNQCEKPICSKCAVRTPIGYRCKECVRGQQKIFETAQWYDLLTAFVLASVLSYIGARFIFGFFVILTGPIAGTVIGEVVRIATRKRRSRPLFLTAVIGVIVGVIPVTLSNLVGTLPIIQGGIGPVGFLGGALLWQGVYAFLAASTAYYRLSGISISI